MVWDGRIVWEDSDPQDDEELGVFGRGIPEDILDDDDSDDDEEDE